MKNQIEKNVKLVDKWRRNGKDDKKREKMESEIKLDNSKLSGMKVYSLVFVSVIMIAVYQGLKYYYDGVVVAKLPFVPFSIFQRILQAGIATSDPSDCGMV